MKKISLLIALLSFPLHSFAEEYHIVHQLLIESLTIFKKIGGEYVSEFKKAIGEEFRYTKINGEEKQSKEPFELNDEFISQKLIVVNDNEVRLIHDAKAFVLDKKIPAVITKSQNNSIKTITIDSKVLVDFFKPLTEAQNNSFLRKYGVPDQLGTRKHTNDAENMNCIAYANELLCSFTNLTGVDFYYKK